MTSRQISIAVATAVATFMLGACTTVVQAPRERVVVREMPPPRTEVITVAPAPNYNWVPGHWAWRGNQWVWINGHWVATAVRPMPPMIREEITIAPSPSHVYVRGHWVWRSNDWVWVHGTWVLP